MQSERWTERPGGDELADLATDDEDSSQDETLERLLDEGVELIHGKEHAAAIVCFDQIIAEYGARFSGATGERHVACQSIEEFLAFFQSRENDVVPVVWVNPCFAQAHYYKAYALIQQSRFDEAARQLEQAIEMNPMHSTYYLELAYIHARQKMFDSALSLYNHAVQVDYTSTRVNTAAAYRGIGYVYIENAMLSEATRMYQRSLELDPENAIAKTELEYIDSLKRLGFREARPE